MAISLRKTLSIEEYAALKTAYGHDFSKKDLFFTLLKPFLFIGVLTFVLYYYWWLSLIMGVVATLYQYQRINLLNARREYQDSAFKEINNFINNLTQILTNPNTTTLDGLRFVKDRTNGEFHDELTRLIIKVQNSSENKITEAFEEFRLKFEKDIVLQQYIDQLESALRDGRNNVEILKNIRSFHNGVKLERDRFIQRKMLRKAQFTIIVMLLFVAVLAITLVLGLQSYLDAYAHTPVGWICNTLFLGVIFLIFTGHLKKQEDDEVLEVKL